MARGGRVYGNAIDAGGNLLGRVRDLAGGPSAVEIEVDARALNRLDHELGRLLVR
jgi:hypothetical protein